MKRNYPGRPRRVRSARTVVLAGSSPPSIAGAPKTLREQTCQRMAFTVA